MPTLDLTCYAGNGMIDGTSSTFSAFTDVRGGSGSYAATYTGTGPSQVYSYSPFAFCEIERIFLPFDASVLPGGAVVSAAELRINGVAGSSAGGGGIEVVQSTQASTASLPSTFAGFAAYSAGALVSRTTGLGGNPTTFANLSFAGVNALTLNASGVALVQSGVGGAVKLAILTTQDADGTTQNTASWMNIDNTRSGGTAPVLRVTYTAPEVSMPAVTRPRYATTRASRW